MTGTRRDGDRAPAPAESTPQAPGTGPHGEMDLREVYRLRLLESIGGWQGTVITAIPPVVFVVVNATAGLRPALISAVGTAVALAGYRLLRRQPVQQAMTGLAGVLIGALIAARTGQARGYFLFGIWSSFAYGAVFAASTLVGRPLVGVVWEFLDPTPGAPGVGWHRRRSLRRAYLFATLAAAAVFAARAGVQLTLFRHNATGWLAFARIAMGYPLTVGALAFGYWVVTRARHRLTG